MNEDYKKIALEDVKKGQRIQIALYHATHVASYTGKVVNIDSAGEWIALGYDLDEYHVYLIDSYIPDIFLLEDVPEPKVVRTETVTITHYDDGIKTETPVDAVPTVIKTADQFEAYEEYLKQMVTKDRLGDYWTYRDGRWCWTNWSPSVMGTWISTTGTEVIKCLLPLTSVEEVGD